MSFILDEYSTLFLVLETYFNGYVLGARVRVIRIRILGIRIEL